MWTTAVLSLVMRPDEAETVAGDLIEECHDTVYPAVGNWRADFRLTRQVAGFVWRVPLAWGARRTGRVRTGALVAAGAHAIGWGLNAVVTAAIFVGVIRNEPAMLNLFHATGGWGEQWFLPLMLLPVVLVLGAIGGAFGRALGRRARA